MAADTVQEIKRKLSIEEVIKPYVKLTRAGRSMKGLCPFHKEKTPSFTVSLERGTFHCFGCGVGGDMFSFVEKIEGVDFKGALTILAEKAGVEIVYDPAAKESASRAERLREVLQRTVEFYISQLGEGRTDAYRYAVEKRGLTKETIKGWQLGYAPDDWRQLLEHLSEKGFKVEELRAAGVIKEADGKPGTYYDRFRNRLMFPIKDAAGRTVAFTGRALDPNDQAKYLNSPETELFHKSDILYGLDQAKDAIRTRKFAVLVEGQMDLLHCHQAGFTNTVALSGTAFTDRHAGLLKRYSENLMLILDADPAGLTATAKSAELALTAGMKVKAVTLSSGKDPADLILENPKEFTKAVGEAKPIVEFFLSTLVARENNQHRLVTSAERVVLPLIRAIKSPMEQEHFIQITSRSLTLSPEAVRASLSKFPKIGGGEETKHVPPKVSRQSSRAFREELLRGVVKVYPDTPLAKLVEKEYARIVEAPLPVGDIPEAALFKTEELFGEKPPEEAAYELLKAFEEAYIREAYQQALEELRKAEATGSATAISIAEKKCEGLAKKLSKANLSK